MWDRTLKNYSEWSTATILRQQEVEQCIQRQGDVERLASLHSKKSGNNNDPCGILPFAVVQITRDEGDVEALGMTARRSKEQDQQKAAAALEEMGRLVGEAETFGCAALANELKLARDTAWESVGKASVSLGEIASKDPAKRKGRNDLLVAQQMNPAQMKENDKTAAYKEIRRSLVVKREDTTFSAAKALLDRNGHLAKVEQILGRNQCVEKIFGHNQCADDLKQREEQTTSAEKDVASIIEHLELALKVGGETQAACKARKDTVCKELDAHRKELKSLLQQIQAKEAQFQDCHIEHEAMRKQIESLKEHNKNTDNRLAAARTAAKPALQACGEWRKAAKTDEGAVREKVKESVQKCRGIAAEPVLEADTNKQLSIQWLTKLVRDKVAELACLESDKKDIEQKQTDLQEQKDSTEPDQDSFDGDVDEQQATLIDEHKESVDRIVGCSSKLQEMQHALESAQAAVRQETDSNTDAARAEEAEEEAARGAQELAEASYEDFPLWHKAKPRVSFAPLVRTAGPQAAAANPAGTTTLSNMISMQDIERMIREQAEQIAEEKFQQFLADMQFRRGAAGSAPRSEADLDWEYAQVEHFSIGSPCQDVAGVPHFGGSEVGGQQTPGAASSSVGGGD